MAFQVLYKWRPKFPTVVACITIASGAISTLAGNLGSDSLRNSVGPLLFVLLMTLLLVNLYTTGRKAYAKRTGH